MSVVEIRDLYTDPDTWEALEYRYQEPEIEAMQAALGVLALQPDRLSYLDSLDWETDIDLSSIESALSEADPSKVLDDLGKDVVVWMAVHSLMEPAKKYRQILSDRLDYDGALFEKARLWIWQRHHNSSGQEVLQFYRMMERLMNGALDQIDLPGLLQQSARPGITLSQKRLDDYGLIPLKVQDENSSFPYGWEENWSGDVSETESYWISLDAPVGFALTYKGRPQAVVAVAPSRQVTNELMVIQLQGVKGEKLDKDKVVGNISARGLAPIDWQKFMVEATAQLAANLGMSSLGIQAGENNFWVSKILRGQTEPHLPIDKARKAYDVPAMRLGFNMGEDSNWHRDLAT